MNSRLRLLAPLTLFVAPVILAQTTESVQPGVPVSSATPNTTLYTPPAGEDQRVYGERQSSLITREAEQAIAEKFRAVYGQAAAPRLVIYVNRALATPAANGRTPAAAEAMPPTLADRMTVREIERIFGRVLRLAGATLADANLAVTLLAGDPGVRLEADKSAKERAALAQIADIAVEVLISSRNLSITRIAGDYTYEVPDIQVTAIRLSDAAILGQAAASDVIGHGGQAVRIARQFAVTDITEATVFALLQGMSTGPK